MNLKQKIGNHKIFTYDKELFNFIDFFKKIFKNQDLQNLHLHSNDYNQYKDRLDLGILNDSQTDLHNIFYDKIKYLWFHTVSCAMVTIWFKLQLNEYFSQ